jgi:cardiolipin synthase (CMP-forming)
VTPPAPQRDRVVTIPNLLSALRLAGVPVFLWLALGPRDDGWAVILLMASGISDYLDGRIARRWGMTSRLGELLDPAADRLYILATLAALTARSIVPLWLTAVIVGRDVVLALTLPVLRRHGSGPLPVHFLGKAATLNLLYAFPMLLLSVDDTTFGHVIRPLAWTFTGWGTGLYLWAGWLYLVQVRRVAAADRPSLRCPA